SPSCVLSSFTSLKYTSLSTTFDDVLFCLSSSRASQLSAIVLSKSSSTSMSKVDAFLQEQFYSEQHPKESKVLKESLRRALGKEIELLEKHVKPNSKEGLRLSVLKNQLK
ncbi:6149_t:CDS:2, partial [Funneliformis caledonium]